MATTDMFVLKPLTNFARATSPFTAMNSSNGKLIFLHTGNLNHSSDHKHIEYIKDIKNKNANAILLYAGHKLQDEKGSLTYDFSINRSKDISAITGEYKIINKGNLRTGIVSASPDESNVIQKIKALSTYLKKEKNCSVVVCLSQLGYKNKNTTDDVTLAKNSTDLDIIISGHAENFHLHPVIALNSNNAEVIIHSPASDATGFGKIEIDFDGQGRKKNISFTDHSSKNTTLKQTILVA